MTDRELRKLKIQDLLEMLLELEEENLRLKDELAKANARLEDRDLKVSTAGSIAEAALKLNGIFEAAQAAADQYVENVKRICDERDNASRELEMRSAEYAKKLLEEAEKECAETGKITFTGFSLRVCLKRIRTEKAFFCGISVPIWRTAFRGISA